MSARGDIEDIARVSRFETEQVDQGNLLSKPGTNPSLQPLCFLLRLVGIVTSSNDSKWLRYLNMGLQFFYVSTCALAVFHLLWQIAHNELDLWMSTTATGWFIHGSLIYSFMSSHMRTSGELLNNVEVASTSCSEELAPTNKNDTFLLGIMGAALVIFLSLLNIIIGFRNLEGVMMLLWLPTDSVPAMVYAMLVQYLFTFCWFIQVPFIFIPCHLLTERVKTFAKYLEDACKNNSDVDIRAVMHWYDALCDDNKRIEHSICPLACISLYILLPKSIFAVLVEVHAL